MTEVSPRIRQLSEEVVHAHEAFLVDLSFRGERHSKVLEVFADTDAGITADECAAISRDLSTRLDHENLIQGRYNLVVSSPGLDRPLKLIRQYRKNIGRDLKVRYRSEGDVRTVVGRLVEAGEDSIVLQESGKEGVLIAIGNVVESKVEIEFGHSPK
jgi:ribosome maturation factor RimP